MQGGTELNTNIIWQFNFLVIVLFSCLLTLVHIPFMIVKSLGVGPNSLDVLLAL